MTKYIDNGIHYGFRTYGAGLAKFVNGRWSYGEHFAAIIRKAPKTYGKRTAFGQRTVLKQIGQTEIGKFPSKRDATWAAKQWLQMRFGGAR